MVVTGASAIVFEQAFEKLISTVIGSSTQAGAVVLSSFFAGLAIGGLGYPRLSRRFRSPLLIYASLEGCVGVAALVFALEFSPIQSSAAALVHAAGDRRLVLLFARLLVAALWILPPAIAIGATFPASVGALEALAGSDHPNGRQRLVRLYALNVFGAAIGALFGPYVLFARFGIDGGLLVIAGIEAVVVAAMVTLARRRASFERAGESTTVNEEADEETASAPATRGLRILVALAGGSGFLLFSLEVLWLHLIGVTLGTSVYSFAIMLTLVLLGLFGGATLVSAGQTGEARRHPAWVLPCALLASSVVVLSTGALWDRVPLWIVALGANSTSFAEGEVVRFAIAAVVIGAPSLFLGMLYPALFRDPLFPRVHADRYAGQLAAVNALGSIVGALVTAFVLIPSVGSERSLRALAMIPALLALPLVWRTPSFPASLVAALASGALTLFIAPWNRLDLTSGTNVYFRRAFVFESSRLLGFFEDAAGGMTTVVAIDNGSTTTTTLLTNGKFQGNDSGEVVEQISFGLVPAVLGRGRDAALVVGLGTGQTARVVAAAGYRNIDIAEISPGIRQAARREFGSTNGGILDDPRVSFHLEDGRNFLLRSNRDFDLVSIETTSVWFAGAANLYSREMYRLIRAHLRPRGLLQQWVQFHHASADDVQGIIATLRAELPYVSLWVLGSQGCLVASDAALAIDPEAIATLEAAPEMHDTLAALRRRSLTLATLGDRLLLDALAVDRLAADAGARGLTLTTDANRHVEYSTPRHNLERREHATDVVARLVEFVEPSRRDATRARFR